MTCQSLWTHGWATLKRALLAFRAITLLPRTTTASIQHHIKHTKRLFAARIIVMRKLNFSSNHSRAGNAGAESRSSGGPRRSKTYQLATTKIKFLKSSPPHHANIIVHLSTLRDGLSAGHESNEMARDEQAHPAVAAHSEMERNDNISSSGIKRLRARFCCCCCCCCCCWGEEHLQTVRATKSELSSDYYKRSLARCWKFRPASAPLTAVARQLLLQFTRKQPLGMDYEIGFQVSRTAGWCERRGGRGTVELWNISTSTLHQSRAPPAGWIRLPDDSQYANNER